MRKTLAVLGFMSSLLVCAQANATIAVSSDPIVPFSGFSLETFDTAQTPTGTSANPGFTTTFGGGATFSGDGLVTNSAVTNAYAQPFLGSSPGASRYDQLSCGRRK